MSTKVTHLINVPALKNDLQHLLKTSCAAASQIGSPADVGIAETGRLFYMAGFLYALLSAVPEDALAGILAEAGYSPDLLTSLFGNPITMELVQIDGGIIGFTTQTPKNEGEKPNPFQGN